MTLHAGDRFVRGACPHDCPDTCAFIYDVKNGKLVDVTGDPDHPMTRGGLCVKLNGFAEHHYNPERLLYPMRRTGSKGSGAFERISWDEALAEIKPVGPTSSRPTARKRSCRTSISGTKARSMDSLRASTGCISTKADHARAEAGISLR